MSRLPKEWKAEHVIACLVREYQQGSFKGFQKEPKYSGITN